MLRPFSIAILGLLCLADVASAQALRARAPIARTPVVAAPLPVEPRVVFERRLVVKFADAIRARANADGTLASRAGRDLVAVEALARQLGARFEPLIRLPEPTLADLESRAMVRSGTTQPDLAGIVVVTLPADDVAALEAAGNAFLALEEVELAYVETNGAPPPGDIAPPTPNLVASQTYRATNPGLGADAAWSLGWRGGGVRISDCEYGWIATHEDLVDIDLHLEPGQTIHPQSISLGYDNHGTAVVGETSAVDNAYGCSGIAPDATVYTYPERSVEENYRRVTAITHAIADSRVGDVVLLEMQTTGVGGGYGPAELDPAVWLVCKAGTDAGVVVVGAAGNGNQNLSSSTYASYMALGNSGAILVGAGSSNASHDKLSFSTYGARVDVQGWGENVFTLGYGNFATYGGDPNQRYTASFNGTSSASPFVAAACAILQQRALASCGSPLTSQELRALLVATGVPQGSGGHIGPFVSLPAALAAFPASAFATFCAGDGSAAACPCANVGGACRGCENSIGDGGARLVASGSASVSNDALALRCDGMPATATSLYFQGSAQHVGGAGAALADGVRCVAGTLVRLGVETSVNGRSGHGAPLGDTPISVQGQVPAAGATLHYQTWYRDPTAFCSADTYNFSNGLSVVWTL